MKSNETARNYALSSGSGSPRGPSSQHIKYARARTPVPRAQQIEVAAVSVYLVTTTRESGSMWTKRTT
jgi:hypothetical protein